MSRAAFLCLACWLVMGRVAAAQPRDPATMNREIQTVLRRYDALGSRPFQRKWPGGNLMEELKREPDGSVNYSSFHPTGGYAVRYQRKPGFPGQVVKLERYYSDGKTELLLIEDERIVDYTSYWENGQKKSKYQRNRLTSRVYYDARDKDGRQVYPVPRS